MGVWIGVGGPRLDVGGGGWDLWPLAGLLLVFWIGRRVLRVRWGPALLVAGIAGSLAMPIAVHAWGVVATAAAALAGTLTARFTIARGSAKGNDAV
jgi:alanine dehydrogenase